MSIRPDAKRLGVHKPKKDSQYLGCLELHKFVMGFESPESVENRMLGQVRNPHLRRGVYGSSGSFSTVLVNSGILSSWSMRKHSDNETTEYKNS
jgi:hypothetical protein